MAKLAETPDLNVGLYFVLCPVAHALVAAACGLLQLSWPMLLLLSSTVGAWLAFNIFNNGLSF